MYYDSAEGVKITKVRALKEVENHGCNKADFLIEVGDQDQYEAQAVLDWLGY